MTTRLLEIRDRGTTGDGPIMRRAGFGDQSMVYLVMLATQRCQYDPYAWGPARTMKIAHRFIEQEFASLADGDVIDVEFILGERATKKTPECVGS